MCLRPLFYPSLVADQVCDQKSRELVCDLVRSGLKSEVSATLPTWVQTLQGRRPAHRVADNVFQYYSRLLAASTMLTNDSYFMGNLYHILIYSLNCVEKYGMISRRNSSATDMLLTVCSTRRRRMEWLRQGLKRKFLFLATLRTLITTRYARRILAMQLAIFIMNSWIIIIILPQFIRRRNMSESLQGRRESLQGRQMRWGQSLFYNAAEKSIILIRPNDVDNNTFVILYKKQQKSWYQLNFSLVHL